MISELVKRAVLGDCRNGSKVGQTGPTQTFDKKQLGVVGRVIQKVLSVKEKMIQLDFCKDAEAALL